MITVATKKFAVYEIPQVQLLFALILVKSKSSPLLHQYDPHFLNFDLTSILGDLCQLFESSGGKEELFISAKGFKYIGSHNY